MTRIAAAGVSVRLGGRTVLDAADVALGGGEMLGIVGPNGAGKTTLLRALAGLQPPAAGRVTLDGRPLDRIDRAERARSIGYLPQGGDAAWPLAVELVVGLGRLPHRSPWAAPSPRDAAAVAAAMRAADVVHLAARPFDQLSGGEAARVLLARALAGEPRVLLADEPIAGLDPAQQLSIMAHLRRLADGGAAVAAVLHDLVLAARFCTRLVLVAHGRVVADGPADAVLSDAALARHFRIRAARVEVAGHGVIVPLAPADTGTDGSGAG